MTDPPVLLRELRAATGAAHRALEARTGADRILDRRLEPAEYRRILDWQARAHAALEPLVIGYSGHDYRPRGGLLPAVTAPEPPAEPALRHPLAAPGILYVLEGGSLGGAVIHRHLMANDRLVGERPFTFYAWQAREGVGQWRAFLGHLRQRNFAPADRAAAVAAANAAFALFARQWEGA